METGYLNFHDEEHFSDFSLSLGQHNLLDDSESSLLAIDDDFDYVEARMDTSGGLWGTEQELNGDMAVLPVSGVASVIPKIESMKEDFAKVLTDWQEHIGYLQASDMGEDIDMAELSMGIPEKLNVDLPEDIFQNESTESQITAHSSPLKKRQCDSTPSAWSPKAKTISESSSQDIDVIGLDLNEDIEPELDLMHVDCDHANSFSSDIDYELLAVSRGKRKFDLASYITGDDEKPDVETTPTKDDRDLRESPRTKDKVKITPRKMNVVSQASLSPIKIEQSEKNSENEDSVDVETIVEQMPVLEAGDVKSLLEQFEASETSNVSRPIRRKAKQTAEIVNETPIESNKSRVVDQSKRTITENPTESKQDSRFHKNIRDSLPKEVIDRIKASARKRVISVIPALSSPKIGNRSTRMQEAAATLSRTKLLKIVSSGTNSSANGGRVDGSVQLDHDYCSNTSSSSSSSASSIIENSDFSNETGSSAVTGMAEISSLSVKNQQQKNETPAYTIKPAGYYMPITKEKVEKPRKSVENNVTKLSDRWADCGSKKDSGLESGEVSDASEETSASISSFADEKNRDNSSLMKNKASTIVPIVENAKTRLKSSTNDQAPIYEMKIRSALATSILQLRKGVLTKTKSLEASGNNQAHNKSKAMISVLKKPPVSSTSQTFTSNYSNESIVTTKNSSNNEVQNIIVRQETSDCKNEANHVVAGTKSNSDEARKPPRRKLNLAEYRSRREQTRSDNSRTCSPVQPMTLVYIHHASTTTEPLKDDPENPVWSEREIVSVLKPKADFEEEKSRDRAKMRDIAVQTGDSIFEYPSATTTTTTTTTVTTPRNDGNDEDKQLSKTTNVAVSANANSQRSSSETRATRMRERKNRRYRRRRASSGSSSRSRSRSPLKINRERSKNRNDTRNSGRNKSRSRSRRCYSSRSSSNSSRGRSTSNPRRRRVSHRRSSVSSSSSWSSRSRSRTRSTSRSRSRSPRSRSRSSRSRSMSRSSSRYSSCSRSSSRSNVGRSKWSGRGRCRIGRSERRTSYDRYRRGSSSAGSSHGYRGWRRSPRNSYRKQYDTWYHKEKRRQMEERRVIYVGRLDENTAKADLRRRFEAFGPVLDISVHFREHGDNYGFVTFAYKNDAYEAVEHGNDDASLPRYDLSFGGRRAFCKVKYADLDGMAGSSSLSNAVSAPRTIINPDEDNTFDLLLKEAKAKLRKRKV